MRCSAQLQRCGLALALVLALFLVLVLALHPATAAGEDQDWRFYGGDAGGRHYSALAQINRQTVANLDVAWVFRSGDAARFGAELATTSAQSTPILLPEAAGSSLVYCAPYNRVVALDPGTGVQRWDFDPGIDRSGERPFRCRGVSYAEEPTTSAASHCRHRLYMATHDRRLWAIDARDGRPCTGFGDQGRIALYGSVDTPAGEVSNSSAPVIANGVVIVGSSVIDFARATTPRGAVQAFATGDGRLLWQFDPLQGQAYSGSANVWAPMSTDAEHGLVFLPTSAPSPDYYGVDRPGANPSANSVVALELATRKLHWQFQHVRHDLWDYDTPAQPILFDWTRDGTPVPALAQLTKQGFVFVLNRLTGESLWETALGSVHEMGPVPAPFQIEWGTPNLGGGIATTGGLFFIGATMDRQIRAFDVSTGNTLWQYTRPNDATATPMTYHYQGRQYVVINAGGHTMFNRGQGDYLYAFALPE